MICLASGHNFAFVSTLGPIPEATSAVRIMSAPPHQSQQSGLHYNLTHNDKCTINVNGTNNISYQQPVNEPAATARGGIGEKFPDANDDVAASDCRSKIQTTPSVIHSGKDEHGALYIPHDLIPLDPKNITLDHAKKYFDEYYKVFATDTDVRCLFDTNKGFVLDYNVSHGEKFKYILTELHQLIKNEGQKLIGDHVVEGFNTSGFRVKSSSQGPTNVAQCLSITKSPAVKEICKKDPFFMLRITYMYVHTTGLMSCYFVKTILSTHLKKFGYNHKPRFTFEEMVNGCNDGRKQKMSHNIIKIGNTGTQQIRKDFQNAEMDSFGMSIRTVNRGGSKKEKDNWIIKIDRSILSVRERDNYQGLSDPWLLVNKGLYPFTEIEELTQAQLREWLSHTAITRTAYQLVYSARTANVSIENVLAEVRKAYLNLNKSKVVGPSKPIVDNEFEISRWEGANELNSLLKGIGLPEASQHPPHLNQNSSHFQTPQNQTPGHASFHQDQHMAFNNYMNQQPPNIPLQQNQHSTYSWIHQNQTPGHIALQQNTQQSQVSVQQQQPPPIDITQQSQVSVQQQQPPPIDITPTNLLPQQQPLFNKPPNTINGSNNKQPTSHLGSNDTSNNNGNMETTERNGKESKGVEALLQQMTDGAACGTSISTL